MIARLPFFLVADDLEADFTVVSLLTWTVNKGGLPKQAFSSSSGADFSKCNRLAGLLGFVVSELLPAFTVETILLPSTDAADLRSLLVGLLEEGKWLELPPVSVLLPDATTLADFCTVLSALFTGLGDSGLVVVFCCCAVASTFCFAVSFTFCAVAATLKLSVECWRL